MNQGPTRISVVSYLNAKPFLYGLEQMGNAAAFSISSDIPSVCASKLIHDETDIGLIPVAMLSALKESHIITSYCIAADGPVESVVLVSQVPLEEISRVILDMESRTSVLLVKILAEELWGIHPEWIKQEGHHSFENAESTVSAVMIGDKALKYKSKYRYCYDLSEGWKTLTGLPFVFAIWASNKNIDPAIISQLEHSFSVGTNSIDRLVTDLEKDYPETDILNYLTQKIRYTLGNKEMEALQSFLSKAQRFQQPDSGAVISTGIK